MRKWFTLSTLVLIFGFIAAIFWYNEWRYSLPTPVPPNFHPIALNQKINLGDKFVPGRKRPVFLHFFNPACPCSRFNIPHFNTLVKEYGSKINFAVVVMAPGKGYTPEKIMRQFNLQVPVLFDTSLASICGVYSTPQAVLIDTNQTLYYRGNYNRARYCTDIKTNYAQMAIAACLEVRKQPDFNQYALTAYGCSVPSCKK